MKTLFAMLVGIVLSAPVAASEYSVASGSTLGFTGSFQGEAFDGTFRTFKAVIHYDAANLAGAKFEVDVDLASVVTGDSDRDGALPDADFFDVKRFPTARFVTTAFRQSGADVIADGTLSLKGASKPVSLQVVFKPNGDGATLDVATTLKRLDFNVGAGEYADTSTIGNEVKVKGHLVLASK